VLTVGTMLVVILPNASSAFSKGQALESAVEKLTTTRYCCRSRVVLKYQQCNPKTLELNSAKRRNSSAV
jgi:hypothetical protein